MKRILLFLAVCASTQAGAQLKADGGGVYIAAGETFTFEGLSLQPSSAFTISSNALEKTEGYTISPAPVNKYIKRYYQFANTTAPFTGTLIFSYANAELSGSDGVAIAESDLRLNLHNGSAWTAFADVPNTTSDFISSAVSGVGLIMLALSRYDATLPLKWLSFEGRKDQGNIVLQWVTSNEVNTADFVVQHSADGSTWTSIGTVKAKGTAGSLNRYILAHSSPVAGNNYYRVLQRDADGRSGFSKVITIVWDSSQLPLRLYPNPVVEGKVWIELAQRSTVQCFNAAGLLVLEKALSAGKQELSLGSLPAGTYVIRAGSVSATIIKN